MQSRRRTFKVTAGADMRREGEIEGDELGPGRGTGGQTRRDGAPVGTGRQSGGGYHYRQQLPAPSSCSLGPYPGPVANNKQQQVPLGNKDLIIRMLAEIFQVRQDECGQVRWHQVSTSLVPISLYSRTTSKWLDYLLTAPLSIQANDPANTMSPDSRDFLLLLQQFHQQTSSNRPTGGAANSGSLQHQQLRNSSSINTGGGLGRTQKQQQQQVANLRGQDAIVFQVIGHDFIDGQCRKILNVKIRQPGTRLGQASDYFVYWKDQSLPTTSNSILTGQPNSHSQHGYNLHHQQYSASSYASNASIMQQASSMKPPPNAQMLNPPQLVHSSSQLAYDRQQQQQQQFQSSHYQHQHQHQHQPTWGLNFASMNDAKLFYDICSLNIVNLDFNSEYLKQLTINDCGVGGGIGKQRLTSSNSQKLQQFAAMSPSSQMLDPTGTNQRIMPRNSRILNQQQQQQQQQQQRLIRNKTSLRMLKQDTTNHASTTGNSTSRSPGGRQASISRCPSCKQNFVTEDNMAQSTAINNNKDEGAHLASHQHSCPVHGQHQQQQAPPGGGAIRARSRSTTRQALGARGGAGGSGGLGDPENLARARSFSTPASPEPNQCPVHRRRHRANTECELEARDRQHQQQQLDYLKRGGRQGSKQTAAKLAAAQKEGGPEKPARGFLRSSYLLGSQEEAFGGGGHQRRQQQQQGAGSINQIAQQQHHGGTQYNMDGPTSDRLLHVKPSTKTRYMGYLHNVAQQQQQQQLHAAGQYYRVENPSGPPFELDANGLAPMSDRSLFRRMQTGTETFDTFAHRDARLARAQYANSRNMKEFLSLDAGGLKSSTSFQLEQQQRFQQHRKHMRQQTTATTTTNGESKNNNGNQPGQAEVYANFGAAHQAAGKSSTTGGTSRLLPVRPGAGSKGGGGGQAAGNEEQQRGAPSGQPLIQCNVSTTTEDLPMDSSTRKRMLKLTSEEIISEHTEPRSVSTSMAAVEQMPNTSSNQSQPVRQSRESAELPPVRAVSLGPELAGGGDDNRVRGREARSDVGRRRSLERSGCVDLELSLPASSFKKKERLSPLPQSSTATSPQQEAEPDKASLGNGSPEPPARGSSRTVAAVADSEPIDQVALDEAHLLRQADEEEEEEADQIYGMGHYTQQPKGALPPPAPQESSRRPEYHNRETNNLSLLYAQSRAGVTLPYITQEMRTDDANEHSMFAVRSQQLASFKSAPDMRRLNEGEQTYGVASSRILRPMDYAVCNDDDGTTAFLEQQHCFAVEPNKRPASKLAGGGGRSNLSSYAVPLCTTVKRPPLPAGVSQQTFATRRQCHSCPNSLRRKRRPSSANSDQPFYTHEPLAMASGGECSDLEAMAYHHHHHHLHHMPPPKTPRTHIDNCCSFKRSQQQQQTGYPSPYQDHDHDHLYHQEPMQHGAMHACCDNINGRLHPGPIECPECLHGAGGGDHGCHLKAVSSKHQQQQLLESHWRHHRALHHYHHHGAHPYHQQPPPAVGANARAVKYDAFMRDDMQMHHHGPPSAGLHQAGSRTGGDDSLRRSQPGAAAASMRPHSSQSVRSPMQYGLYESDCDEGGGGGEDYDNDDDDEDISSPARPTLQQFYGSSDYYYHHYNSGQNTSSKPTAAGRPTGALSAATFVMKPVQGYDQTMSRACLKSRQRSRSQPPGGTGDNYDHGDGEEGKGDIGEQRSAQHLTKSMENVEKLIREVQNELRALKRQPLGAAQIDMKPATAAPTTGTNRTNNAGATPEAIEGGRKQQHQRAVLEMAQEQDEAEGRGRQPLQDNNNKQLSYTSATRRAGQFKCVGAIRKAGFLSVKKWILKRRQSIELARKQGWRRYWVCLRGTALLFHSVIETKSGQQHSNQQQQDQNQNSSSQRLIDLSTWIRANCSSQLNVMAGLLKSETNQEGLSQEEFLSSMSQCYIEEEPRHLIIIDGAIAQPIPEHPRRDFVFCLSTTFGDAYLFQASCQLESDNWISAIHNACAASIARDLVRDEAIKLFETKIRHFELEAEKKLFLRHRLESRLTSMSSMCNMGKQVLEQQVAKLDPETSSGPPAAQKLDSASKLGGANSSSTIATTNNNRKTMRSLLYQLSQQLMALDSYIEQLHCEIYQLRCYLSSCSAQNIFYHNLLASQAGSGGAMGLTPSSLTTSQSHDLPHPKTLLMHVSKPTKLLLIKLGVFTVPSFHAFIHARQESAKSILDTIQQQSSCPESPIVELRIRSRSISETLMSRPENVQLAKETETLIELANLKTIPIVLSRELFNKIRGCSRDAAGSVGVGAHQQQQQQLKQQQVSTSSTNMELDTSDDRCSIEQCGQFIKLNVKLNSSSNSSSIIKQVLRILEPNCNELDFLNYYLRLATITTAAKSDESTTNTTMREEEDYFVVKRKETLEDWSNYAHIEMLEKVVFRVELTRSRMDEDDSSVPFGICVEGQLLSSRNESLLNVYCSYIEWGSVADKAGLQDEDEFLMINGCPVGELDLMFVECIIQEATKLRAVIRTNRSQCPAKGKRLNKTSWRSLDDDDDDQNDDADGNRRTTQAQGDATVQGARLAPGQSSFVASQVITDEYLTSLVCPPPPTKSSAFLRTDTNLLRQKSDLGLERVRGRGFNNNDDDDDDDEEDEGDNRQLKKMAQSGSVVAPNSIGGLPKSRSQHRIDVTAMNEQTIGEQQEGQTCVGMIQAAAAAPALRSSAELARQLMQKTERITRLLGRGGVVEPVIGGPGLVEPAPDRNLSASSCGIVPEVSLASLNSQKSATLTTATTADHNHVERLKKSVLELIETEYAYVRHLETINDHYMSPLCETSFLNIFDLGAFSQTCLALLRFQRGFFSLLTRGIFEQINAQTMDVNHKQQQPKQVAMISDDFERFNWIVQRADSFECVEKFKPILASIASAFTSEADKFKIYASYCVAYSKLQRILHPKTNVAGGGASTNFHGASSTTTIISIPNSLNTFAAGSPGSTSNIGAIGTALTGGSSSQHRDLKLFNLIGGGSSSSSAPNGKLDEEARTSQFKQLTEFLANLDSSSSSASFSLQRSSLSEQRHQRQAKLDLISKASSSDGSNEQNERLPTGSTATNNAPQQAQPYQKSAHHQNFESYLIKPIQRIVKYPMLLNSIALVLQGESSATNQSSYYNDLQTAIKHFETVINHVNESQRVHDEYGTLFDHIERQFFEQQALDSCKNTTVANLFGPHQPPITLNIAKLLYSGPVAWLNVADFTSSKVKKTMSLSSMLFVFESCVVFICKEQIRVAGKKKLPQLKGANENQTNQTTSQQQSQQQQSSGGLTSRVLQWSTGVHSSGASGSNSNSSEQLNEIVRYQTLIPVSEVQVRSVSSDNGGKKQTTTTGNNKKSTTNDDNKQMGQAQQFNWELFQCSSSNSNSGLLTKTSAANKQQKQQQSQQQQQPQQQSQLLQHRNSNTGKVYLLASPSNEERSAFLRKIRFTIRESVRNMSLPTVASTKSSSSNKSLALKKLSTSSASSATSNTNINTSGSLSPPESSGGPDLMTQDQSTTIKCEPYNTKKVHETSIEVQT